MKTEIQKYKACQDAVDFRSQFDTFEQAWEACPRGDWMLWIAKKLDVDIRLLTLAKGHCANTIRHLMKDQRSIDAVDAAIAFGEGRINEDALKNAAYAAAYTSASAAASAAYDACDAAYDAYDAGYDAYDAYDAYDTAYAAAYAAAKKENQKQTADICRRLLTDEVLRLIKQDYDTKRKSKGIS